MEINDLYNKLKNMKIKYKLVKKKLPLNREELTTSFISDGLLSKIDWNYTSYIIEINNKPEIYIKSNTKLPGYTTFIVQKHTLNFQCKIPH